MSSKCCKQVVWTRDEVKKLIEAVEARECLWNVKTTLYHNITKRRTAISEISSELNKPDEEIKKKIHTLRAQFSKERSKMKNSKSGSGVDETYTTKWEFYNMMQFMFCHNEKNVTTDSMDSEIDIHDTASSSIETINESVSDENAAFDNGPTSLQLPVITEDTPATQTSSGNSRQNKKTKRLSISEHEEKKAMDRCLAIIGQARPRDEWCIFGDNVGNELRLLQTAPDLQIKLKNSIQKSILEISCEYMARQFPQPYPQVTHSTPSRTPSLSPAPLNFERRSSEATSQQYHPDQPLQASLEYSEEPTISYFINVSNTLSSLTDIEDNQ